MNALEHTMTPRIGEFVAAINELNSKSTNATARLDEHLGAFNMTTVKVLSDLDALAAQFTSHGRALTEAVALLENTDRHTRDTVASRHAAIEALVTTLDAHTEDLEQRLRRFSSELDESLGSATARADDRRHRDQ
jgi:chaperonin cofactor prefoldin